MVQPVPIAPRMRRLAIFSLVTIAVFGVMGWDTKERARNGEYAAHDGSDRDKWHALYYCHRTSTNNCRDNEHAWLAQLALDRASPGSPWGFTPTHPLTVNDLATGYYRTNIGARDGAVWDPDDVMGIPRRVLPGAANFAGVPDFSYSIYDWINKNELCPPVQTGQMPAGTPKDCHNYSYWQGGAFNASHFGSQATRTYQQLHATALSAARRAQTMRAAISANANDLEMHRDAIHEAELEALAFEGYAQHFLQDRWAMGHMWDRWGSPEYNANGIALDPARALMAGAFTGILHGYQAIGKIPDAMSAPEVGVVNSVVNFARRGLNRLGAALGVVERSDPPATSLYIPQWRHTGDEETHNGVGDYVTYDMSRRRYAASLSVPGLPVEYNSEQALPVSRQYREFMNCSAAGFAEIIQAFGQNGNGYGVDAATLNTNVSTRVGPRCYDVWATNSSIVAGMGTEFALAGGVSTLAQAGFRIGNVINNVSGNATLEDLPPEIQGFVSSRNNTLSITRIYAHARLRAIVDPNGIDLARGGLGRLLDIPTGDTYPVASYIEPANIDSLPATDPRGRDAQTIYGFFNRAHADHFCTQSATLLSELRRATEPNQRATCRILGQRIYEQTRDDVVAISERMSFARGGNNVDAAPLCQLVVDNWTAPTFTGDALDELHPGYVPWNHERDETSAYAMADGDHSFQSVANWCDQTPIINYDEDADLQAAGIVAVIEDTRDELIIRGLHFGSTPGELKIGRTRESAVAVADIRRWRDNEIRFGVEDVFSDLSFDDQAQSYVFVSRAGDEPGGTDAHTDQPEEANDPGRNSAGRFIIRRDVRPPEIALIEISGDDRDLYYRYVAEIESDPPDEDASFFDRPLPESPAPGELAFWPIPADESLRIEIRFNTEMDREGEREEFLLGEVALEGRWINGRTWRGEWEVPTDDEYEAIRGPRQLSVSAQSRRGARVDGDRDRTGDQPDMSHTVLLDPLPVHVQSLRVRGRGRMLYEAEWRGGPDYQSQPNLTHTVLGNVERTLQVTTARAAPADGRGELRLELSGDVTDAPVITIGGAAVEIEGQGQRWRGRFDLAEATELQDENGDLQVTITLGGGRQDSDPRTAVAISDPAGWSSGRYWAALEDQRGGTNSVNGGSDVWHRIGPPPALSLLVILDASGSMGEQTRMENARSGINQTMADLPEDEIIEFAAVIFNDCNSFSTRSFTRDAESIRAFLTSATPAGGTPLADAHDRARNMFASLADPRSDEWSFVSFTDGAETCDGNVVGSVRNLDMLISQHQAPTNEAPEEPDAPVPPVAPVNCQVETWRGYEVEVSDGGLHLDSITLIEHNYLERALPDGRCIARYETKNYGVYYGSIRNRSGGPTRNRWGINSRSSESRSDFGTSRLGEADLLRVRNAANAARRGLISIGEARQQVETAVNIAAPESG